MKSRKVMISNGGKSQTCIFSFDNILFRLTNTNESIIAFPSLPTEYAKLIHCQNVIYLYSCVT